MINDMMTKPMLTPEQQLSQKNQHPPSNQPQQNAQPSPPTPAPQQQQFALASVPIPVPISSLQVPSHFYPWKAAVPVDIAIGCDPAFGLIGRLTGNEVCCSS